MNSMLQRQGVEEYALILAAYLNSIIGKSVQGHDWHVFPQ